MIKSSLKEETGLAGIKCSNKKASDSTIQATSSTRNRLTTWGTHLACCAHGPIPHLGDQTKEHDLCYADLVLWPGTCFPLGFRQSQGPRLSEATQNGRLTGPTAWRPPRWGSLPFCATHLLSFLVLCGQPMKIYCLSLFLARVAVVTTATYHPKDSKRCHRVMLMSLPQLQNQCRQTLNHVILFRCEQTALGTHSTEPNTPVHHLTKADDAWQEMFLHVALLLGEGFCS